MKNRFQFRSRNYYINIQPNLTPTSAPDVNHRRGFHCIHAVGNDETIEEQDRQGRWERIFATDVTERSCDVGDA